MRLILAAVVLLVVALIVGLVWYVVFRRGKVRERRATRLSRLRAALHAVDVALDNYSPEEPVGQTVVSKIRTEMVAYYSVPNDSPRKKLAAAEMTRNRIRAALWEFHRWSPLETASEADKEFIRVASDALRETDKEITA